MLHVFLGGLVMIGISIPLILKKIPPNMWYGFRTKKTLSDKQIWYKANKYMGKDFLMVGIAISIVSLSLFLFTKNTPEPVTVGIVLIPVIIVVIRGFIYLNKL